MLQENERMKRDTMNVTDDTYDRDGCPLGQNDGHHFKNEGKCLCMCTDMWLGPTCECKYILLLV